MKKSKTKKKQKEQDEEKKKPKQTNASGVMVDLLWIPVTLKDQLMMMVDSAAAAGPLLLLLAVMLNTGICPLCVSQQRGGKNR